MLTLNSRIHGWRVQGWRARPTGPGKSPPPTCCWMYPPVSLNALPSLLAIPPLNLLVAACAGAAFRRRRAGRAVLAGALTGLVLLAMPAVSGSMMACLEAGLTLAPAMPFDPPRNGHQPQAIVILSGDQACVWQDGKIAWVAGPLTVARDQAGAALARRTHLPVLVSGGSIRPGAPSLAADMAENLHMDFATEVHWQEAASQDTWQNARFSAAMLRQEGIARVYVVTHAWHMRRALLAFRRAGLTAVAAPVQIDAVPDWRPSAFVPSVHAWQDSYWAIHELIGWAWYAIRP